MCNASCGNFVEFGAVVKFREIARPALGQLNHYLESSWLGKIRNARSCLIQILHAEGGPTKPERPHRCPIMPWKLTGRRCCSDAVPCVMEQAACAQRDQHCGVWQTASKAATQHSRVPSQPVPGPRHCPDACTSILLVSGVCHCPKLHSQGTPSSLRLSPQFVWARPERAGSASRAASKRWELTSKASGSHELVLAMLALGPPRTSWQASDSGCCAGQSSVH